MCTPPRKHLCVDSEEYYFVLNFTGGSLTLGDSCSCSGLLSTVVAMMVFSWFVSFFLHLFGLCHCLLDPPPQAEGLWLGLVERALSETELDLSFEALLGLRRETPQGWPTLARTFFERMCCQHGISACAGDQKRG